MERRIGEVFNYKGKMFCVKEHYGCLGCYFKGSCKDTRDITGECGSIYRTDNKAVIFVKYKTDETPKEQEKTETVNKSILEEALEIVNGSRNVDYGDPVESFKRIAQVANLIGKRSDFEPVDCCNVLIATKLVRESKGHKRDNLTDLAGYSHIKNLILESE